MNKKKPLEFLWKPWIFNMKKELQDLDFGRHYSQFPQTERGGEDEVKGRSVEELPLQRVTFGGDLV